MRFRKLRIAWSAAWVIACVLLIVLWVRSYYFGDVVQWSISKWSGVQFTSMQGQLTWRRCSLDGAGHHGGMDFPDWLWTTAPAGGFSKTPATLGFELRHLSYFAAFPHCAPIVICAALAAAPFLVGRLPSRFSVRTLLIAMTLVAVLLGVVIFAAR
jgi:hypothetical protein